jgi:hypothetical protein
MEYIGAVSAGVGMLMAAAKELVVIAVAAVRAPGAPWSDKSALMPSKPFSASAPIWQAGAG